MIRRFNRYELKYMVHARTYRAMCQELEHFMTPDEHGDGDGFYRVVSLYYDSPDLSAYWSKLDGLKFRRKLRLRVYPGSDIREVRTGFVEIKQRTNRTVQKKRVVLPIDEAERLCAGGGVDREFDAVDAVAANEVAYMVRAQHLRPQAIVSYRRRAYMGSRYESGMRLTFDMQLQGRIHALEVNAPARNRYFAPPDWMVMEVKVNERIPAWMVAMLARHECRLQRISKYCAVVAKETRRMKSFWSHKENLYYG